MAGKRATEEKQKSGLRQMLERGGKNTDPVARQERGTVDLDLRMFESVLPKQQSIIHVLQDGGFGCLAAQLVGVTHYNDVGEDLIDRLDWLFEAITNNVTHPPFISRWSIDSASWEGMWVMLSDRSVIHFQEYEAGIMVRAYLQATLIPGRANRQGQEPLVTAGGKSHCAQVNFNDPMFYVWNGNDGSGLKSELAKLLNCRV